MDEISQLRAKVAELSAQLEEKHNKSDVESFSTSPFPDFPKRAEAALNKTEVERYGRQLIMSEIGAKGANRSEWRIVVELCRF